MAGYSQVQNIGFYLSNDTIHLNESCANITSNELHTPSGKPVSGGINDLALGTTEHNYNCNTCGHGKKSCPGHRGSLRLNMGITQPIGISEIRKWLKITCLNCGTILPKREKYIHFPLKRRLNEASSIDVAGETCPNCDAVHPKIVKDEEDHFTFWAEPPNVANEKRPARIAGRPSERHGVKLYPDTIRAMFERVSDADCQALGRDLNVHPRHLILRVINIPPNTIRPGMKSFTGAGNSNHDSTNLLQHIVRRNALLPEALHDTVGPIDPNGVVSEPIDKTFQNLQQLYFECVMGSSSTNATQGNSGKRGIMVGSRAVNSFMRSLPRKSGYIRRCITGKRTFFISRSTISGNMNLSIAEVGVPLSFARTLQVKEIVQEFNRDWLMPFVLNGRKQYPGCTHIIRRATGEIHDIAGLRDITLEAGDIIYRDLINGDLVFFNRAPSLERSSINVHRAVVIKDPGAYTFQMNVLACEGYNADFDGDAMVLWAAREPSARAEASIMSSISNCFISTKTSGPVNGQVQDSTIGAYELTLSNVRIDKFHAMALFAKVGGKRPNFVKDTYTGRDIVSMLLEQTPINYAREPTSYSSVYSPYIQYPEDEMFTKIVNGVLETGVLDKKSIGAGASGGVFHLISREFGPQKALDMIFALQQITLQFLMWRGLTVSTADLLPSVEAAEKIKVLVSGVLRESEIISDSLIKGEIIPPIDSNVHDFYESQQMNALKIPEDILEHVLTTIHPRNNGFFKMIAAGSKGSNPNLIHVSGCIGQTEVDGNRIVESFAFRRTSPYFPRFSTSPAAYGFVGNSYMTGMTSGEFIAQDMHGRADLIKKALTTARTGYFMRKGAMNNQSSVVDNLLHVTKDTKIIQMIYGEDGLDARELERVSFKAMFASDADFAAMVAPVTASPAAANAVAALNMDRALFRKVYSRIETNNFKKGINTDILVPVNVRRIVESVITRDKVYPGLDQRIELVADLCERLPYILINEIQEKAKTPIPLHKQVATTLMTMLTRLELNPKVLEHIDDERLEYVIDRIRFRYSNAIIDYGSAVGIISSHCVAEPLTQDMLNSHHNVGGGGNAQSGLNRIAEIYSVKKISDEAGPRMLLPLVGDLDVAAAQNIANNIEFVTFRQFIKQYDVILEKLDELVYPKYLDDAQWIKEFSVSHPLIKKPSDLTNWCFRFVVDKSALVLKAVELELIIRQLRSKHSGLYVVHTAETVDQIIIRVWNRTSQFRRGQKDENIKDIINEIIKTPIRGIKDIVRAKVEKISYMGADENGAFVNKEKYAVAASGTNLYNALLHPSVNPHEAISNSIGDTKMMFGIEAARAKIINETRVTMESNTPNLRHLFIYADEMTRTGNVTSIERGGLSVRESNNVLLRMAYGAPIQVVTDATFNNTRSKIYGIAAPQMLGSTPQIGTLYNKCVVNNSFVKENTQSIDSIIDTL
jgi:DNA-directed RNA polymerase beta' subunit